MAYISGSILEDQKNFNQYLLSLNPRFSPYYFIVVFSIYQSNHNFNLITFSFDLWQLYLWFFLSPLSHIKGLVFYL